MKRSPLSVALVLKILVCSFLLGDVRDESSFTFLGKIKSIQRKTRGWQEIVYQGSRVDTTEFLIVAFSHGNPADCDQRKYLAKHAVRGGSWSKAITAGNDDKSVEIWYRHVTHDNLDDLGEIETWGAGSVKAGMLVYDGIAGITNQAEVTICNGQTKMLEIKNKGVGPYLVIAGSDNGTKLSGNEMSSFAPGDDVVILYLTNERNFSDPNAGLIRGAIASLSLIEDAQPTRPNQR
ncbi:MAG: hypothetical protein ACPGN3_13970 [Opitutales bacterium]